MDQIFGYIFGFVLLVILGAAIYIGLFWLLPSALGI